MNVYNMYLKPFSLFLFLPLKMISSSNSNPIQKDTLEKIKIEI
jgi:hypothetical protein